MANKSFDPNINYYNVLDINRDASGEEIDIAFDAAKYQLLDEYRNTTKESKKASIVKQIKMVEEAYDVLSDSELRSEYDKATSQLIVKKGELIKVEDVEEADEELVEEANINWGKVGLTAGILALILATGIARYAIGKHGKKDKIVATNDTSITATVEDNSQNNTQDNTSVSTDNTTVNTETQDDTRYSRYYGDITDTQLVHQRAQTLADEYTNAGIINLNTGVPYTVDEVENILLYINGAYVPENEQDVYDMYTEWLNFICGPLNMESVIYQVNYRGGETSFQSIIEQNAANPKTFDLASAATYGQGNGYEYVEWLQTQYFKLLYATSEEEYNRIYSEVWQSWADIMKGNGYTFSVDKSEYTITEQELLQDQNIGIANQISFWLFNFEVFRNTKTQEQFDVINKYISAVPEEQHDTVSIDEMFEYINAVCDQEAYINGIDYAVDDEDNSLHTMVNDVPGETWGVRVQSNTKAAALERLASKSLSK